MVPGGQPPSPSGRGMTPAVLAECHRRGGRDHGRETYPLPSPVSLSSLPGFCLPRLFGQGQVKEKRHCLTL